MDEPEWLRRNAPAAPPSAETTRRHRAQLRAAIAEERAGSAPGPRRPHRARPRHRVLLGATAIVALCALVAVVVTLAGTGDDTGREVATPAADTTAPAAGPRACGTTLPAQPSIPDGYLGPHAASAPEADTAASASQLVETWTSSTGSIEVRWPSDTDKRPWSDRPANSADSLVARPDAGVSTAENGVASRAILFRFPNQADGCDTLQFTIYGNDAATVAAVFDEIARQPFAPKDPTVATSSAASSLPTVVGCPAAEHGDTAALRGGQVTTAGFATPEAALTSFVGERDRRLLPTDYAELQLPDGSRGYVQTTPVGIVTTVLVTQSAGQWNVARWEASAC